MHDFVFVFNEGNSYPHPTLRILKATDIKSVLACFPNWLFQQRQNKMRLPPTPESCMSSGKSQPPPLQRMHRRSPRSALRPAPSAAPPCQVRPWARPCRPGITHHIEKWLLVLGVPGLAQPGSDDGHFVPLDSLRGPTPWAWAMGSSELRSDVSDPSLVHGCTARPSCFTWSLHVLCWVSVASFDGCQNTVREHVLCCGYKGVPCGVASNSKLQVSDSIK